MKAYHSIQDLLNLFPLWYTASDFSGLLRRERNRSDRSGDPVTYVQFVLSRLIDSGDGSQPKHYFHLLQKCMNIIEKHTRDYEPRILFDTSHLGVLLLDTPLEKATHYINKISNQILTQVGMNPGDKDIPGVLRISSYPLHQFLDYRKMEISPYFTRQIPFSAVFSKLPEGPVDEELTQDPVPFPPTGRPAQIQSLRPETEWLESNGKFYRLTKRTLDIAGSIAGILFFAPVMVVIALLIKLTSRGPVLFRQKRVGYRGRPFVFLKFRTMWLNNNDRIHRDYVLKLIQGKNSEINFGTTDRPLYKLEDDPRITPLGHFLRKFSLDELPQFFNVLTGKMSLVGPRPPIPYEIEAYQNWHYRRILEVKPGITGLWQVYGRSQTTFDEMVRLDLQYVQSRSLGLDLKILYRTFMAVSNTKGAL